ncbi:hypothetical protein R3W88_002735 [Solanum pinnatisectum]|uniref:Aminotransferase-like plant mobile domain-containing protein n=1 Tax=Solanum pinnatisectum TaxID=50273 RepID=A0AAV9MML8_9SOLN|nr:hypothetical protein R3W88_002735 [Solanum pinnatisectum]
MAGYSAYQLDPGPLEPSVLTQQHTHRSRDIWDGSVNMILNTRRCDGKLWDLVKKYPIHPRVLEVIELSGLYGVYRSNRPIIDRSLITSLATITLQDVEVLYGLPVNGDPILGDELIRTIGDWQNICQRLLGFIPRPQDFNRNSLKVTALNAHMLEQLPLPDLATQDIINQMARCYMFWMIAGMMMADTSGNYLKLMYLPMLEDLNVVSSYSWGSATLAYLYRFLCKASRIWAWETVTVLRPQVIAQKDIENNFLASLPRGPRATRWFAHFSWTDTTKHVLKFICEPYSDDLIESLPDYCRIGRDIWRVRAPIFCWDVIEVHLLDRVMRQFGLKQTIPTSFLFDATHFHHDRRGRPNTNWKIEHAQWLPFWNQRLQYICDAPVNREPLRYDDPYLIWFRRNKKVMCQIQRHMKQWYVLDSVRHIHSMVDKAKALGDQPSMEDLYIFRAMVRNEGEKCLTYVHEAAMINVQADYRRDEVHDDHLHPPVRRRGKGGVAGRMARVVEKGRAPIEMDESVSEDDHTTSDIGSISRGQTQEFTPGASGMTYQPTNTDIVLYMTPQISRDPSLSSLENVFGNYRPQHFENAPNFTSSPVPMSMEIPDAMTNLEDSNIEIEGNELDDSNSEVDDNDPENASGGGEPSVKKKRTIFPKLCGTGSHQLNQHGIKKTTKGNKAENVTKSGNLKIWKSENLKIWKSGNLEIWKSGNLKI